MTPEEAHVVSNRNRHKALAKWEADLEKGLEIAYKLIQREANDGEYELEVSRINSQLVEAGIGNMACAILGGLKRQGYFVDDLMSIVGWSHPKEPA